MSFEEVNQAALTAYPALLKVLFPGGRVQGREFVCGDLSGKSGRSLSINLAKGVWRDFARGDSGSDPVSLWAAAHGCSQSEAARILAAQLGLSDERSACTPKRAAARAKQVLVEADKVPDKIVHPTLGQPAAFWVYRDQQGRVLGLVCRWDHPGGKKTIRPYTLAQRQRRHCLAMEGLGGATPSLRPRAAGFSAGCTSGDNGGRESR